MNYTSINPATQQLIAEYPRHTAQEALAIAKQTAKAAQPWRTSDFDSRIQVLKSAAAMLRDKAAQYARLISIEMGKPMGEANAEIEKCAWVCDYLANNGVGFLKPVPVESAAKASFVSFQPLGTVLGIMPWNFPFWQVFRFAAPALMAGNTVLIKHAPNVTGCALAIEKLWSQCGLPANSCRVVCVDHQTAGQLIASESVAAVTLTGSTKAGKAVAALAGAHLKKTVLELGGSDPYLILADADVPLAASKCVTSRLLNAGQSCIAAKRFIAVKEVLAPFQEAVVSLMKQKTYGDPQQGSFDLGPLARQDLRSKLHRQVRQSVEGGARLALGGAIPAGPGWFYPPTLLTDVPTDVPAFTEELFGPVAAIIPAENEAHAVSLANQTSYGLGAAVFSRGEAHASYLAEYQLQAGACFINDFVKSDPRLPFGGVKASGYGRELSVFGLREFVNIKTVYRA